MKYRPKKTIFFEIPTLSKCAKIFREKWQSVENMLYGQNMTPRFFKVKAGSKSCISHHV